MVKTFSILRSLKVAKKSNTGCLAVFPGSKLSLDMHKAIVEIFSICGVHLGH